MPSDMSPAEIAEDRYEQVHGDIMHYRYGWHPVDQPLSSQFREFDVRDRDAAVQGLVEATADAGADVFESIESQHRMEVVMAAWTAFEQYVDALAKAGGDFSVTAPDQRTYWIRPIEH